MVTDFWSTASTLVSLSIIPFAVFVCHWFFGKRLKKKQLPSLKCSGLLFHYSTMKHLHRKCQAVPDLKPCIMLEAFCAFCQMFERERIFQLFLFTQPFVFIFKPETFEVVLNNAATQDKSITYKFLQPWLGTGLFTSSAEKHRHRRKLLKSTFHFKILEDFVPVFNHQSNILVSILKKETNSAWIEIVPLLIACTLDVICETAMGVSVNAQHGECSEYNRAIHELGEIYYIRSLNPLLYYDFIFNLTSVGKKFKENLKITQTLTKKVIKEKKEEMVKAIHSGRQSANDTSIYTKKHVPFLELLLKHHLEDPSFTEEDIREEVETFMFGGNDTTTSVLSFALYNIGLEDEIQRLIHHELDDIFEGDCEREITRDDLTCMKYLECVIKETLRLYSPPATAREAKESFIIKDYTVARGSMCLLWTYMLHRDPTSFPNPEKFDPERFFPENCIGRHPYAYLPFSAGSRNCIGQKFAMLELKTVLANILRNFTLKSKDPRDKVILSLNFVLGSMEPLKIQFTPRNKM